MLRKEVLPARVWDPCRRHEDRSPPLVGVAPMLVFVLIIVAILGRFIWQHREDDRAAEEHQRALEMEMELRANIRAIEDMDRHRPIQSMPTAVRW